jgi:hypothetical protein
MRFTYPDMERPFKVWTPLAYFFALISGFLVIYPFIGVSSFQDVLPFLVAIIFTFFSIPVVKIMKRFTNRQSKV